MRLQDEERGQALIIVVLSIVVVIGLAAVAIDVAGWYQKHHQAQVSADAAALAAANCLAVSTCTSTADASQTATSYASTNGVPASSVTFGGGYVTVTTSTTSAGSFVNLGFLPQPTARAVASYDTLQQQASLFSLACSNPTIPPPTTSSGCAVSCSSFGTTVNGNNLQISGAIETNGALSISTNNNASLGALVYGDGSPGGPDCTAQTNAASLPFPSHAATTGPPQLETAWTPFPDTYASAASTSNCYLGALPSGLTGVGLSSGIYASITTANSVTLGTSTVPLNIDLCAKTFSIGNSNSFYGVTLSSSGCSGTGSCFTIGNSFTLTADGASAMAPDNSAAGPHLAVYDGSITNPLTLGSNNNGMSISGTMYAPAETLTFNANNSGPGLVEANQIIDNANNVAGGPTVTVPGLGTDFLTQ